MTTSHETNLTINDDNEKDVIAPNVENNSGDGVENMNEEAGDSADEMNKFGSMESSENQHVPVLYNTLLLNTHGHE
jgi:hypothetical protein